MECWKNLAEIRARFKKEETNFAEVRGSFRCFEAQVCVLPIPLAEFWVGSLRGLMGWEEPCVGMIGKI